MDFQQHLDATMRPDGTYNLAEAVETRAQEIEQQLHDNPDALAKIARKAANSERLAWQARNRDQLKKVFMQTPLPGIIEMSALIPLGDDDIQTLGRMTEPRIRLRIDLRTEVHLAENRTFDQEFTWWMQLLKLLPPGGEVSDIRFNE